VSNDPALVALNKDNLEIKFKTVNHNGKTFIIPEEISVLTSANKPVKINKSIENKKQKPPPMLLIDLNHDAKMVSKTIKSNDIQLRKPISTSRKGHEIYVTEPNQYRNLIDLCDSAEFKYVTWQLDEEKEVKCMVKNVPTNFQIPEIEASLKERGYVFNNIVRIKSREKGELPMIAVNVPKTEKGREIFNLNHIENLKVKVENRSSNGDYRQCYRCQKWGYVSYRCRLDPKCLKCAGSHRSYECTIKPDESPKCANCDGPHVASSYDCRHHPRTIRANLEQKQREIIEKSNVRPGQSYAQTTASSSNNKSIEEQITEAINKILPNILNKLMSQINKQNGQ
jgi:hypothetical protein